MNRGCLVLILTVLFFLRGPAFAQPDAKDVLKAILKVRVTVPGDARSAKTLGTEREGNGVVIDTKGHILTIGYIILEAESIEVIDQDGKTISATYLAYDHITGFGILKADRPLGLSPMELGKSAEVKEGDSILVASHGGSDAVQSVHVVSRKEFAGYWEYLLDEAIYTVPAHRNFGGAALINQNRQLVGIGSLFTQFSVPGFGVVPGNVFIPIDFLKPILSDLIEKGRSPQPPRPWLGLNVEETHGRIFITRVTPESPAEKAGLKVGDLILAVDKKEVKGIADFYRKVWALGQAGVEVPLNILKGIQIRELNVRSIDRNQLYTPRHKKRI